MTPPGICMAKSRGTVRLPGNRMTVDLQNRLHRRHALR